MTGHRRLRPILSAAVLAPLLVGAAAAAERGELMHDALSGIGLLEKNQDPIDYHERAPLVMPPKLDGRGLPPPRARATDAAWPKDPEVAERERQAAERRVPRGNQSQGRYNDNNATASVDEIRAGRRAGANLTTGGEDKSGDGGGRERSFNPFGLFGSQTADAEPSDVEPTRDTLAQPPTGYRQAPRKLVGASPNDPKSNPFREREEADPGAYFRQRAAQ